MPKGLKMGSYYWIKVYHEVIHDPKMGMLSDHLWRRFFELCLLAGEYDQNGYLPSVADMAWTFRTSPGDMESDLHLLSENQLVTMDPDGSWFVTKFAERQSPLSDAERKARQRERDKKREYYGHDDVTSRDTDTDTDTDKIQTREDTETDKTLDAVVVALESVNMAQIDTVIKEAKLTAQQIVETCAYAREKELGAAWVRKQLRNGTAYKPKVPTDYWRSFVEART